MSRRQAADDRYRSRRNGFRRAQYWGRQLLIFGVHVHVGLDDVSKAMPVVNGLVNRVPHLLALSASSPF